jgi:hypothetical protein
MRVTTHVPKEASATAGFRLRFLIAVVVGYIGFIGFFVPEETSSSLCLWLLKVGRETAWFLLSWAPLASAVSPLLAFATSEEAASARFPSMRVTTHVPKEASPTAGLRLRFLTAVVVGYIGYSGYIGFFVPEQTSSSLWLLKVGRETAGTSLGVFRSNMPATETLSLFSCYSHSVFKDCHAHGFVWNWTIVEKDWFTEMMIVI